MRTTGPKPSHWRRWIPAIEMVEPLAIKKPNLRDGEVLRWKTMSSKAMRMILCSKLSLLGFR